MVCRAPQAPQALQALQALQDAKAFQDVTETMARKDLLDSQDCRGHLDFRGHLGRRVHLAFQADKGPLGIQAPEVNRGPLQMWIPAPESPDFLGYQAQEDQKEVWGPLE